MSRAELLPGSTCEWDPHRREWLVRVPAEYLERQGLQVHAGEIDHRPRHGHHVTGHEAARTIGQETAALLALPGPVTRAVRAQVRRNNRRRYGP